MYLQKSPVYLQKSTVYPPKSPEFVRKWALYILKRASHICKTALHICKKKTWSPQTSPLYFRKICHLFPHKSPLYPHKEPSTSHWYALDSKHMRLNTWEHDTRSFPVTEYRDSTRFCEKEAFLSVKEPNAYAKEPNKSVKEPYESAKAKHDTNCRSFPVMVWLWVGSLKL